jgi:hypothetical protein
MAKNPKTHKRKQAQAAKAQAATPQPITRRDMLRYVRNGAISVAAVAGAGYIGRGWFLGFQEEHDLSRLGQGMPAVVQIHDPQCPICTSLQRETRAALEQFDDGEMLYLVADIKQAKGAAFAAQHNVPHVTLLLFDGQGEVSQVLRGMRNRSELSTILAAHFEAHGNNA